MVLGAGREPTVLDAVVLSRDEMQFLLETLDIDEVPVVLNAMGRYDNVTDHDTAMASAANLLRDRELLDGEQVHPDLALRLRTLYRPHWVVALRLIVGDTVSRMCLAKGDDAVTVALRGPESYVVDEATSDLVAPLLGALGPAEPLELSGMNAPTAELVPIFDEAGDPTQTAARLSRVGQPPRDAPVLAGALVHCHAHTEIVGVVYRDGGKETAPGHVAVFDTRHGRFLATSSEAEDGTKWTSLSSATPARLRSALQTLIDSLPDREEFRPPGGDLPWQ